MKPAAPPRAAQTSARATGAGCAGSDGLSEASHVASYVTQLLDALYAEHYRASAYNDRASGAAVGGGFPQPPARPAGDVLRSVRYGVAPTTVRANRRRDGRPRGGSPTADDDSAASQRGGGVNAALGREAGESVAEGMDVQINMLKDLAAGIKKMQAGDVEAVEGRLEELMSMLQPKSAGGARGGDVRRQLLPNVDGVKRGGLTMVVKKPDRTWIREFIPNKMRELRELDADDFLAQYQRVMQERQQEIIEAARLRALDASRRDYVLLNKTVPPRLLGGTRVNSPPGSPLHVPSHHALRVEETRQKHRKLLVKEARDKRRQLRAAPQRFAHTVTRVHLWLALVTFAAAGRTMHDRFQKEKRRLQLLVTEPTVLQNIKEINPTYKVRLGHAAQGHVSSFATKMRGRVMTRMIDLLHRWLLHEQRKDMIRYIQMFKARVVRCQRMIRRWLASLWTKADMWRAQLEAVETWVVYLQDLDVFPATLREFRRYVEHVMGLAKQQQLHQARGCGGPPVVRRPPKYTLGQYVVPALPLQAAMITRLQIEPLAAHAGAGCRGSLTPPGAGGDASPPASPKGGPSTTPTGRLSPRASPRRGASPALAPPTTSVMTALNVKVVIPFAVANEALVATARTLRKRQYRELMEWSKLAAMNPAKRGGRPLPPKPAGQTLLTLKQVFELYLELRDRVERAAKDRVQRSFAQEAPFDVGSFAVPQSPEAMSPSPAPPPPPTGDSPAPPRSALLRHDSAGDAGSDGASPSPTPPPQRRGLTSFKQRSRRPPRALPRDAT